MPSALSDPPALRLPGSACRLRRLTQHGRPLAAMQSVVQIALLTAHSFDTREPPWLKLSTHLSTTHSGYSPGTER